MKDRDQEGLSRFTFEDLLRIRDLLEKKESELSKELLQIRYQSKYLSQILSMNNRRDETFAILLPRSFFEIKTANVKKADVSKRFNWKSVALRIIKEVNGFMTTEMIYDQVRMQFPTDLPSRNVAIRNFSSALHYLFKENKLNRFKDERSREFIYGLPQHFNLITGLPKQEFLDRLKRGREGYK